MKAKGPALFLMLLLAVAVIAIAPSILFWAIGVLFGLHIPMTWATWAAAGVLISLFGRW